MNKVLDSLKVSVTPRTKLLNVSDIHLAARQTLASRIVEDELSNKVESISAESPAVIVLNGDIFELWAGKEPSVDKALRAHSKLSKALHNFSKAKDHRVVFIVGNHDGSLAWDESAQSTLAAKFSADVCLSLEVAISTKKGTRSIYFEHGHMLDKENSTDDPRDPNSKSLGQYIVQEIMPMIMQVQGDILKGLNHLQERDKYGKFAISKLFYKDLLARIVKLVIAILSISLIEVLLATYINNSLGYDRTAFNGYLLSIVTIGVLNFIILVLVVIVLFKGLARRANSLPKTNSSENLNKISESKAREITKKSTVVGFITGHTHQAQLSKLEDGFYANSGCGVEQVEEASSRFKMPKPFISRNNVNWIEVDLNGEGLEVSLFERSTDNKGLNFAENLFSIKPKLNIDSHLIKTISIKY